MTAKTSEMLAQALDRVSLDRMAAKARADEYHDYLSTDPMCAMTLMSDLVNARNACPDIDRKVAIERLVQMHLQGAFDASMEESDEWAASPEGQAAFGELISDIVKGK